MVCEFVWPTSRLSVPCSVLHECPQVCEERAADMLTTLTNRSEELLGVRDASCTFAGVYGSRV